MALHQDHFALVIGVDDYPKYRSLNGAKQDAHDFHDWLLDPVSGGGLPADNAWLVLSSPQPARPIHNDIDDALVALLDRTGSHAERLYLYFSGHGLSRTNTATDLCLSQWSMRRKGLALDSEDYLSMLSDSGIFREIVLLLDCCRIRKVRRRALRPTLDPARPADGAASTRTFVGYATEFLNAAHEAALDEASDQDDSGGPVVRGHFTRALISALQGAAADPKGGVMASKLKNYLEVHTPEIACLANHTQKPEIRNGLPSNPEPVFGSALPPASPPTVPVVISFSTPDDRKFVLENGNLDVIMQATARDGVRNLDLSRGNYFLREQNGPAETSIRITGHETEPVNVAV